MTLEKIRKIIFDNDTKGGRLFDYIIQSMIILSLITFSINTLPDLSKLKRSIHYFNDRFRNNISSSRNFSFLFVSIKKLNPFKFIHEKIIQLRFIPFIIMLSLIRIK